MPSPPVLDPPAPSGGADQRPGAGPKGNEHLTSITGALLLVLLAVLGVTILRIGQLIWLHLFLGLALIGPVALKMASTGYRFARYYAGSRSYRRKGPPETWLRLLAPLVVGSTVVVFATGVLLLVQGPSGRGLTLLAHKASFIVWLGATGLHVLGHLAGMPRALAPGAPDGPAQASGAAARWIVLGGALVGGLVLALALLPHFGAWTAAPGRWHH